MLQPQFCHLTQKSHMGKKPDRSRSLNPSTPYLVYECLVKGRVFYIGIAHNNSRSNGKWGFYASVVNAHDGISGPTATTTKLLRCVTGQVFAWMIRNGCPQCDARIFKECVGRDKALKVEREHIRAMSLLHLLANKPHNMRRPLPTRNEILHYIGYQVT